MVLSRLFKRKSAASGRPQLAADTRIYAVGDIHGRDDLLAELLDTIRKDAALAPAVRRKLLVFVGDYVDRSLGTRGVMDQMCAMESTMAGFECHYLRGNHDQWMMDFLDGLPLDPAWITHGGAETLQSYGVQPPATQDDAAIEQARNAFCAAVPAPHKAFLAATKFQLAETPFLFVHAGIRPGVPFQDQSPVEMMWIRDRFLTDTRDHGAIIVHGHTPTPEPQVRANRIGIDTGAWDTGRLTALVAMPEGFTFLTTD